MEVFETSDYILSYVQVTQAEGHLYLQTRYTLIFVMRNSFIKNLYWDSQMAKKLFSTQAMKVKKRRILSLASLLQFWRYSNWFWNRHIHKSICDVQTKFHMFSFLWYKLILSENQIYKCLYLFLTIKPYFLLSVVLYFKKSVKKLWVLEITKT